MRKKINRRKMVARGMAVSAWPVVVAVISFFIVFFYIALITYWTPPTWDTFDIKGDGRHMFAPLADVWHFYQDNYYHWGGRVAYVIFGWLMMSFHRAPGQEHLSEIMLALLNSGVFLLFLVALFFLAFGRAPRLTAMVGQKRVLTPDLGRWWLLVLLSMTVLAKKGETFFWISGYANYLWVVCGLCWFTVPYRLALVGGHGIGSKTIGQNSVGMITILRGVLMLVAGVAAGMTSEFGVLMVLLLLSAAMLHGLRRDMALPSYLITGLIGLAVGYGFLMNAPGMAVRLANPLFDSFRQAGVVEKLAALPHVMVMFLEQTRFTPPLVAVGLWWWWKKTAAQIGGNKGTGWRRWLLAITGYNHDRPHDGDGLANNYLANNYLANNYMGLAVIFFLAALVFAVGQVANPAVVPRAFFVGTVFHLLSALLLLVAIFYDPATRGYFTVINRWQRPLALVAAVMITLYAVKIMVRTYDFQQQWRVRVDNIIHQRAMGKQDILVPPYRLKDKFWGDVITIPFWQESVLGRYYGVRTIKTEQ